MAGAKMTIQKGEQIFSMIQTQDVAESLTKVSRALQTLNEITSN